MHDLDAVFQSSQVHLGTLLCAHTESPERATDECVVDEVLWGAYDRKLPYTLAQTHIYGPNRDVITLSP